jgi:hypothetical protein
MILHQDWILTAGVDAKLKPITVCHIFNRREDILI